MVEDAGEAEEVRPRLAPLNATDDMKEGMNAFLEKRAANFTGK